MEKIKTVLPVKIEVIPDRNKKRGYNLKHNQQHGWKGIIADTWAWYLYKSDANKAANELMQQY